RVTLGGLAHLAKGVPSVSRGEHREREVEHSPPEPRRLGMPGVDDHALSRRKVTGGGKATAALDVDQTGPAGAERWPGRIPGELGQREAQLVHGVQDSGAVGDLDRRAIDDELETHAGPTPGRMIPGA